MKKSYAKWIFLLVALSCYIGHAQIQQPAVQPALVTSATPSVTADELKVLIRVASQQLASSAVTNAPVAEPVLVHNASEAVGAFIHFMLPGAALADCLKLGGSAFLLLIGLARSLRKLIPDSWQVNKIGLALAHAGGELNPTISKLAAAADEVKNLKAAKLNTPNT